MAPFAPGVRKRSGKFPLPNGRKAPILYGCMQERGGFVAAGARLKEKKRKKRRRAGPLLRFYRFLVVLSALIVALYGAWRYMTRLPDVGGDNLTLPDTPGAQTPGEDGGDSPGEINASGRKKGVYTFLVCGTDDGNGGTDTILAVTYDTQAQTAAVMSIPRDTMLNVTWKVKKINSAYNVGGMDLLREKVEGLLGIPMDYTVRIDLQGFIEGVDALGGVWFDVPRNMDYDDPYQDLHIHVKAGYQCLNGEDAMGVVRWRHNNDYSQQYTYGDVGRIETQQAFLKAVLKQTIQPENIKRAPALAKIAADYVDTDLNLQELTAFANQVLTGLSLENVTFLTLPGDSSAMYRGASYVAVDPQALLDTVNEYLNPYEADRTMGDLDVVTLANGTIVSPND